MRNTKLLLSALAIATMVTGCPSPAPTDGGGTDAGMGDTNPMRTDTNVGDSGSDAGITVDCATYCTRITAACTTTHAQYTTMATCMTQCAAAMWTVGAATDTGGNTLGCRIYHAGAAMADPAMHCDHAGPLGGGVCSPFRTDPAVESATATGYVRVDRMGMPAVATALVGPGLTTAAMRLTAKDAYNDSDPNGDAQFVSGIPLLTAISAYHALLDTQLMTLNLTPCSVAHTFPVPGAPAPVPACGVQQYDQPPGTAGHTVASLILPDTLRIDTSVATQFPNGRALTDDVIDPILSVLLLNLSPCAGTPNGAECNGLGAVACAANAHCTVAGTTCRAAATTPMGSCNALATMGACGGNPLCTWTGSACVSVPCEFLPNTATCPAQAGCAVSRCGAVGTRCTAGTLGGLPNFNPHANDVAYPSPNTFPYFHTPQ